MTEWQETKKSTLMIRGSSDINILPWKPFQTKIWLSWLTDLRNSFDSFMKHPLFYLLDLISFSRNQSSHIFPTSCPLDLVLCNSPLIVSLQFYICLCLLPLSIYLSVHPFIYLRPNISLNFMLQTLMPSTVGPHEVSGIAVPIRLDPKHSAIICVPYLWSPPLEI